MSSHDDEQNSQGIRMHMAGTSQTLQPSPVAPAVFLEVPSLDQEEGKVLSVLQLPGCL